MRLILAPESFALRGAFFEVYNTLGCGFLEGVYQESLEYELASRQIPFQAQQELTLQYKSITLKQTYKPDFVCYGKIIVEIKAVTALAPEHEAQLMNYLKITGMPLGFLVNFGHYPNSKSKDLLNRKPRITRITQNNVFWQSCF